MIEPTSHPQPRRAPVRAGVAVRIAAGAGLVATLLVCQAGAEVDVKQTSGKPSEVAPAWQGDKCEPASQPGTQPATAPATQPATQPAATRPAPVPVEQIKGGMGASKAPWGSLPV